MGFHIDYNTTIVCHFHVYCSSYKEVPNPLVESRRVITEKYVHTDQIHGSGHALDLCSEGLRFEYLPYYELILIAFRDFPQSCKSDSGIFASDMSPSLPSVSVNIQH